MIREGDSHWACSAVVTEAIVTTCATAGFLVAEVQLPSLSTSLSRDHHLCLRYSLYIKPPRGEIQGWKKSKIYISTEGFDMPCFRQGRGRHDRSDVTVQWCHSFCPCRMSESAYLRVMCKEHAVFKDILEHALNCNHKRTEHRQKTSHCQEKHIIKQVTKQHIVKKLQL